MTKCKLHNCTEEAANGPCCSYTHYRMYKVIITGLADVHYLNSKFGIMEWREYFDEPPTRELALQYA